MATSTGRGDWPFLSTWGATPYKRSEEAQGPHALVWADWLFDSVGGEPLTLATWTVMSNAAIGLPSPIPPFNLMTDQDRHAVNFLSGTTWVDATTLTVQVVNVEDISGPFIP